MILEAASLVVEMILSAAEVPVKFPSDRTILNTNPTATRLREILQ